MGAGRPAPFGRRYCCPASNSFFLPCFSPADVVRVVRVGLGFAVGVVAAHDHVDELRQLLPLQELHRPLAGVRRADGDLDPVALGVEMGRVRVCKTLGLQTSAKFRSQSPFSKTFVMAQG